jgi:hypothetical protein
LSKCSYVRLAFPCGLRGRKILCIKERQGRPPLEAYQAIHAHITRVLSKRNDDIGYATPRLPWGCPGSGGAVWATAALPTPSTTCPCPPPTTTSKPFSLFVLCGSVSAGKVQPVVLHTLLLDPQGAMAPLSKNASPRDLVNGAILQVNTLTRRMVALQEDSAHTQHL